MTINEGVVVMHRKILVINGHGSKLSTKIHIHEKSSIITPGNADDSYVVSFDNQERHLEEMTSKGQIWPIADGQENPIQWHRYYNTDIHDIRITPLQSGFDCSRFANDILNKKTKWENLSSPAHDVLARGALAVKRGSGQIDILEGNDLIIYLLEAAENKNQGTPLFFCDKELGKVKPLGGTSLSEIYASVALIKEFQASGTSIIVATCSPTKEAYKDVIVQTNKSPQTLTKSTFVDHTISTVVNSTAAIMANITKPTVIDNLRDIINKNIVAQNIQNVGQWKSLVTTTLLTIEIGISNFSKNNALTYNQYQMEVDKNGALIVLDKANQYAVISDPVMLSNIMNGLLSCLPDQYKLTSVVAATTTPSVAAPKPVASALSSVPAPIDYSAYVGQIKALVDDNNFLKGKKSHPNAGALGQFLQANARPTIIDKISDVLKKNKNVDDMKLSKLIQDEIERILAKTKNDEKTHNSHPDTVAFMKAATNSDSLNNYYKIYNENSKEGAPKPGKKF